MRRILLLGLTSYVFGVSAQTPTASFADWKDDAQGAYSIIHDDFGGGGLEGIWRYADTICSNRDVKFTFGAIAGSCEDAVDVNGFSNAYGYAKDVMMAQHQHEIMSHSHTHSCAVGNGGWSDCDATGWGEEPSSFEFRRELRTAHESILNGTGFASKYYIYPYDRFSDAANDTLKAMGYLGSRTGWDSPRSGDATYPRDGYENSDLNTFFPDADGFFRTAVEVFNDSDAGLNDAGQATVLNDEVDAAIATSMWANRELHNVGNSGWGHVTENAYRTHINYLREKVESGELWIPTVSEMMTYQMQKLKFTPNVSYDGGSETATVTFAEDNSSYSFTMSDYLTGLEISSPVTLIVEMSGLSGSWSVSQDGFDLLDVNQQGSTLYINCFPHQGSLIIYKAGSGANVAPVVSNELSGYGLAVNFASFTIDLTDVFSDVETADENLIYTVSGNSGINVSITDGIATVSSDLDWTGSETLVFEVEDEGGLKVTESTPITVTNIFAGHTPFNGTPIAIPGKVEMEEYDEGVEGVVYYEVNTGWEPSPALNPFRPGDDVDVVETGSEYSVGYTETTEWMDYTVDVATAGDYEFSFRVAQQNDGSPVGKISIYLDDVLIIDSRNMTFTNNWSTFESVTHESPIYISGGTHIMRVEFEAGSVDIDYIDVYASPLGLLGKTTLGTRKVYPNPASDLISLTGDAGDVIVRNHVGQVLLEGATTNLNIGSLPMGVYTLQVEGEVGAYKFVKE